MPDVKFESGSFSIFGDMKSQNLITDKGISYQFLLFTPGRWVELKEVSFCLKNHYPLPKIDPHVNFSNFQPEEIFIPKFLRRLKEKRAEAPPPLIDKR